MQYLPVDGLYIYFRYDANQTIACIMNTSDQLKKMDISRDCKERTQGFNSALNVLTGQRTSLQIEIQPMNMLVLELK